MVIPVVPSPDYDLAVALSARSARSVFADPTKEATGAGRASVTMKSYLKKQQVRPMLGSDRTELSWDDLVDLELSFTRRRLSAS